MNGSVTKKIDRRVARTRKALREALVSLSLEIGYDRVTIRKLTDRADIGYATFYRHYRSKDEVVTEYFVGMIEQVRQELRPEMSHYEESLIIYRKMGENRDAILFGISLPREHPAIKPAWDEAFDMVRDLYSARMSAPVPLNVSVNHIVNSVVEMIRWWLTDGGDYSPEAMATMQSELIFKVVESGMMQSPTEA